MIIGPRVPVVRIDYSRLRERVAVARASGDTGRVEAVKVMAAEFVDFVDQVCPHDTNRFANGFIEAAREIGATQRPLHPIRDSRVGKMIENMLTLQLKRLNRKIEQLETVLDRWYYSKGRTGPWLRRKEIELRRLRKRRDRAAEELEKFAGSTGSLALDLFRRKDAGKTQRLATVRTALYGGRGAIIRSGRSAFVRLHNLEPHASFVNRRTRVVSRAMGVLRRVGALRASRAYLETQAAMGGLSLAKGGVSGRKGLPVSLN